MTDRITYLEVGLKSVKYDASWPKSNDTNFLVSGLFNIQSNVPKTHSAILRGSSDVIRTCRKAFKPQPTTNAWGFNRPVIINKQSYTCMAVWVYILPFEKQQWKFGLTLT